MKKLIIALSIMATALTAKAQDIFDNPNNHSYFGLRLSYELACPGDITATGSIAKYELFGNSSGFNIGAIYNLPLWKNLYFEPGAAIYYNTYSLDKDIFGASMGMQLDSGSLRQWGIRIPLNVGYHFDFTPDISISFFTGPEVNISFKGNTHFGSGKYNVTGPAFGEEGGLNRADIKWRFGVGATIFDHYYFAISGAAGLCNMIRDDVLVSDGSELQNLKMRSNLFDITIGYNF